MGGERTFDGSSPEDVVFPAALPGAAEQRHLPTIQKAIEQRRELQILYRKSGATQTVAHTIRPHYLRFIKRHVGARHLETSRPTNLVGRPMLDNGTRTLGLDEASIVFDANGEVSKVGMKRASRFIRTWPRGRRPTLLESKAGFLD